MFLSPINAAQADDGAPLVSLLIKAYPNANLAGPLYDSGGSFIMAEDNKMQLTPPDGCPAPNPDSNRDQPLCAVLGQKYPSGPGGRYPQPGFNPGRVRNEELLGYLYGRTEEQVRANCVAVDFLGTLVHFNRNHGAADALTRVAERLKKLMAEDPGLTKYLLPTAGTLNWRKISGTNRLSSHCFGIAIDLSTQNAPYWRWAAPNAPVVKAARAHYPQKVVEAFESEGFIWGGKWHAFDFMHFEYRPELLINN